MHREILFHRVRSFAYLCTAGIPNRSPTTVAMTDRYSYRSIWKVVWPVLVSMLMEQLLGMVDTAFLGHVGEVELGASAIAGILFMVVFMIGLGFSFGAQIIIGRRNGEATSSTGDWRPTGKVFWTGIELLAVLSVVVYLLCIPLMPLLIRGMVSSDSIFEACGSYMKWRLPSLFFANLTCMFRAFYMGTKQTEALTANSLVMVGSNILLDWLLIFGKAGLPAMGIQGAALASTIAEGVSLCFFVLYMWLRTDRRMYGLDSVPKLDLTQIREMIKVGGWTMVENVLSLGTWLLFFIFIEHLGEHELAIANTVRSLSGLIWIIINSFASTCSSLVSNLIGEGRKEEVTALIRRVLGLCCMVCALPVLLYTLFPKSVLGIYSPDPVLRADGVAALLVMALGCFTSILGNTYLNATIGTGATRKAFQLEIIALAIYIAYCYVLIGRILRGAGLPPSSTIAIAWSSDILYGLSIYLLCRTYVHSGKWKSIKI